MKKFLTLFWYDDIGEQHLYKDVGGIPYAMSKYCGWQSKFAYIDINGKITNADYEQYVELVPIKTIRNSKYFNYWAIIKFLWMNALYIDVLNMYHCSKWTTIFCWISKIRNPDIKTYVKLDMGKGGFNSQGKIRWWNGLTKHIDLFTVETKCYVSKLNEVNKFRKKVKYLPNGFFSEFFPLKAERLDKENIILTVGRLGSYQKNTELLVESFVNIDRNLTRNWKLYLVGSYTETFFSYLQKKMNDHPHIKDKIILTGNVSNKKKLAAIYDKAKIFVLPSRDESWGLVNIEAMYHKNFLIVTDVCEAYNDYCYDGKSCFVSKFPSEDMDKLVEILEYSIKNYNQCQQKAIGASEYVKKHFDWRAISLRLDEYINNI